MTTVRVKPSPRVWLFFILLAAFALRLFRLGVASLWYDETVSTFLAQQDLISLTRHTAGDIHPPLYYYLLHFWGQVAGWSEFSMAFVSLFFGVLLIALTYRVAREWLDKRVALIAAFLVAISPYNLWYSQEVRMYTLGAVLGLASVFFFVRMFSRQSPVASRQIILSRDFLAYSVLSALGMYTLYYFAFLLVFQNFCAVVWLLRNSPLATRNTQYAIRTWILSQLFVLLLFAPWLPIAFRQATDPPVPPWRTFTDLPTVVLESFSALALGQSADPAIVWPILLVIAVVLVTGLKSQNENLQPGTWNLQLLLLGYTFIPVLIIYALSLWKPLYHVRYVFIYSPGFYILLAVGIRRISDFRFQISDSPSRLTSRASRITHHVLRFTLYTLLLLLTAAATYSAYNFWFNPKFMHDDLRSAMKYLAEHWRPGDAVLINAGYTYTAFAYYYDQPIAWRGRLKDYEQRSAGNGAVVLQTGSIGGGANLGWGNPESDFYATTADETRAALDCVFETHPRIWMLRLYDTVVDPDGVIRDYLAQRGRIIDDQGFAGESYARIQGYLTTRTPRATLPPSATRREVLLGGRITLLGFEPASAVVRTGAPLDVNLYWQAQEPTNVDLHLFIGLYTEDGKLVASSDELPLGNALGTLRWAPGEILREPVRMTIPHNVPPGNYVLRVALYDPFTSEPLDAGKSEWTMENGQIRLTNVRVQTGGE